MRPPRLPLALVTLAFFASGAAALVYQVVWQRVLALHTGVGATSVALIVAAFMAGLGLGSHVGGVWSVRVSPRRALAAFGLIELSIGLFGTASLPLYYDLLYRRAGDLYSSPALAIALQLAALLPPTALMGLSLPFLVRASVRDTASAGRTIGLLYAVNMLGSATGALLAPWVLVRHLGLVGAVLVAAAANAFAAAVVLPLARAGATPAGDAASDGSVSAPAAAPGEPAGRYPIGLWLLLYGGSGFCALSLELLWFRLLEVATRSTAFAFGTLLAIYLAGTAAGCLAGARRAPRLARPLRTFLLCQCGLVGYAGAAVLVLVHLPTDASPLAWFHHYWLSGTVFQLGSDADAAALLRLYVALPIALFGPATVLMGLSFPALQRAVQDDPLTSGRKVGLLQAANIVGCVAGSVFVGLGSLRWVGTAGSLRLLVLAAVVFALVGAAAYGWRSVFLPLGAALLALGAALPDNPTLWRRLHAGDTSRTLVAEDSTSVSAIVPQPSSWRVTVNGKLHSSVPFGGIHTRLGATPALVHPRPESVAIVGLGSGDTAWAAACRPETRSISVFEVAGRQLELLRALAARDRVPDLQSFLADPRLSVRTADGRHALVRGRERYDLIEADALWPYSAYSGILYSREFFGECASRLRPGGLMCTWAPTPRVRAAFAAAFPHVLMSRNRAFLIGSNEPIADGPDLWAWRAGRPEIVRYFGEAAAAELAHSVGRLVPWSGEAGGVLPNEDLYPRDEFLTP